MNKLREFRLDMRLTLSDIAKVLNVTSQAVSQYELHTRKLSIDQVVTLCNYYNVPLDRLIKR